MIEKMNEHFTPIKLTSIKTAFNLNKGKEVIITNSKDRQYVMNLDARN